MYGCCRRNGAHEGEHRVSVAKASVSESSTQTYPQHVVTNDHVCVRERVPVFRGEMTRDSLVADTGSRFMVSGELFVRSMLELLFNRDLAQRPNDQDQRLKSTCTTANILTSKGAEGAEVNRAAKAKPTRTGTTTFLHPAAGLLTGLSGEFCNILLCHPDLDASEVVKDDFPPVRILQRQSAPVASSRKGGRRGGDCGGSSSLTGLVSSARHERRLVRLKRIDRLETSKKVAECMAKARALAVENAAEEYKQRYAEETTRLEANLRGLIVRFAAAVSAEMAAEDEEAASELDRCKRETEQLNLVARLASLAATAEHRTRGNVVLRRLPPTHPQHARCVRAATENVKPGFFSSDSPYDALRVLDIYKIENKILLERFQRAVEVTESCRVKGLFCCVPSESLEHVVFYGMSSFGGDRASGASACAHRTTREEDPIDPLWASRNEASAGHAGLDQRKEGVFHNTTVAHCSLPGKPLHFPRAFSRYSTLEEEHDCANPPNRTRITRDVSVTTVCFDSKRPRKEQKPLASHKELDETGNASGVRLLALCRVTINSMHVFSAPSSHRAGGGAVVESVAARGLPQQVTARPGAVSQLNFSLPCPSPGQAEFDSVYFPREEEYCLLNKAFVLPEFLVAHRFVAAPSLTSSSSAATSSRVTTFVGSGGFKTAVETPARKKGGAAVESAVRCPVDGDSIVAASRTAVSVVAGIEAAMNHAQRSPSAKLGTPLSFQSLSGRSSDSTIDTGFDAGFGCERHVAAVRVDRGRERRNGRARRDSIVQAVEQACERRRPNPLAAFLPPGDFAVASFVKSWVQFALRVQVDLFRVLRDSRTHRSRFAWSQQGTFADQ